MRIICWQTILMNFHTLFFRKLGKTSKKLPSAAVLIGALRVKPNEFAFTYQSDEPSPFIILGVSYFFQILIKHSVSQ